jgi:hypothetical protein
MPADEAPASFFSPAEPGPPFTEAEWRGALTVLDHCLQDYVWHDGENLLTMHSVVAALHAQGLTLALIEMLFRRLIEAKVFRQGSHTIKAGYSFEAGQPVPVFRSQPDTTHYVGITRECWYGYLRDQRPTATSATRDTDPARPGPDRAGPAAPAAAEASPSADGGALPQGSERPPQVRHESFADFSRKQRQLLLTLQGKPAVSLAAVLQAVYPTKSGSLRALEQLVARTNRRLAETAHRIEIKRQHNTLRLRPI